MPITGFDPWFLRQIEAIIYEEKMLGHNGLPRDAAEMRRLKAMGFSDKRLATLAVRSVGVAGGLAETPMLGLGEAAFVRRHAPGIH